MAKIKYLARLNGQIVGTRSSERTYTHAVVINGHDKTDHVATWCGRLELAQGEQRKYQRYGFRADIVPVEILAPKAKPAAQVQAIAKPAAAPPAPASSSAPASYAFYIQEKRSPRGKFTMGNNPRPYRTAAEAFAMLDELNEHGGCGPLRVVDQALRLIERPIALTWSIDDRGNQVAQAAVRKYSAAYEATSAGGRYQVRVDGFPIGHAADLAGAQAIAQAHHDRPAA